MRALIRNDEVMTEDTWSEWVRNNIPFLTGTEVDSEGQPLKGDGWTLIENYVDPETAPESAPETRSSPQESEGAGTQSPSVVDEPADDDICTRIAEVPKVKTFVINGREFTEDEIKNLLIAE